MKKLLFLFVLVPSLALGQPSDGSRVGIEANATGGANVFRANSVTGTPQAVKNTRGQVFGVYAVNKSHCRRYLKIYNKAAADVVLGTTVPVMTVVIFPERDASASIPNTTGASFSEGISIACTNYEDDANASGATANECGGTVFYK